jgi:hypothetical protein
VTKRKGDSAERARAHERRYRAKNREKRRAQSRAHYDKNRDAMKVKNLMKMRARRARLGPMGVRELKLHWRYRITLEDYDRMLLEQGGGCAVCGGPPKCNKRLTTPIYYIDHDHNSGRVRGLLCFTCNAGIGSFYDRPGLLRAAAEYIERSAHVVENSNG